MSNFFGNFVNQQVTRTMGTLQNMGVGIAKSVQANVTGYAASSISRSLSNTFSPLANTINNIVPGTGRILGELVASTVGRYATDGAGLLGSATIGQLIPGTNIQHGRYVYNRSSLEVVSSKVMAIEYSGLVPDVQGDIPPQYVVTIQNSYNKVIKAALQDSFVMSTTSDWIPFLNPKISDNLVKIGALFHMSLFPRFASRRVWRGTSPIQMKLTLKFEAINDAWTEVVRPCLRLMQMSLPGEGSVKPFSWFGLPQLSIPVLEPPGPSPFMLNEDVKTNWETGNLTDFTNRLNTFVVSGSDQIRIKIGRLVEFNNVIVENVQVEYLNKFGADGKPVGAKVDITFSTYEIYTKEAIEESHNPQV